MRSRYLTNISLTLLGGFLLVVSQAFAPTTMTWLMLGVGVASLAIVVPAIALPRRGALQRSIDGIVAVLGTWTIIAGLAFAGTAVTWLGFASGAAIVGLAFAALTAHELSTERVVHSLEVHETAHEHGFAGSATA